MKEEEEEFLQYVEEGYVVYKGVKAKERRLLGNDINKAPYNSLCFMVSEGSQSVNSLIPQRRGFNILGTIFLIGDYYGLTAAHLLMSKFSKNKEHVPMENYKVYPFVNGEIMIPNAKEEEAVKIVDHRIHDRFANFKTTKRNVDLDLALVRFDKPIGRGRSLKLVIVSDKQILNKPCEVAGYPCDKIHDGDRGGRVVRAYIGDGEITNAYYQPNLFQHNVQTFQGQSGSPVILKDKDRTLIGIHTSYNKEKSINTGIIFTEDVMAHIFGWIEEIETPPFSVSTYDHGHNHVYTFQEYKQRHLHNSPPVKKETLNPDVKLYDFNWRLNPLERHHFTIEGEKIGKRIASKERKIVCSHESFPLGQVSKIKCSIKTLEKEIGIGVITKDKKQLVYQTNSSHDNLQEFCFFNFSSKKKEGKAEESFKVLYDRKIKRYSEIFPLNERHYLWTLIVDLRQHANFIEICRDEEPSMWEIPTPFQGQDLYLAVYLSDPGDCVEVASVE